MESKNEPLVTIMIPVYNREHLIKETLESALNQEFDDYEVVVVDNKSTDDTFSILQEYKKKYTNLRIFQNEKNLGPVLNWKVGIEKSRGKYLKILWSDDQIAKNYLKETVPILEKNDDSGFVYTTTVLHLNTTEIIDYVFGETGKYLSIDFIEAHYLGNKPVPLSPGNAIFRKNDIKESLTVRIDNPKKLDFSRYGAGNDLLLYLQIANRYKYFYFLNKKLSVFKVHDESFSVKNNLEEYYLISKVYFIKNNSNVMSEKTIRKFYTKLYCNKKYRYIIQDIDFSIYYPQLIKEILIKIKQKIKDLS
ncbi:MAG: glycosyltransferase [Candidatus Thermoplasmatota archaeon]|nr:glycosyltransferase [Candidatus Thermoplasmatota archaeon]